MPIVNASRLALPLVLVLAGCAETGPTFATPAAARRGAWQQFCEQAWNVPQASQLVAARGAEGWELVAMYNGALCYKRPSDAIQRAPAVAPSGSQYVPVMRDPGF
jgi:hypothetical protein